MQRISFLLVILIISSTTLIKAQEVLPKSMINSEEAILDKYLLKFSKKRVTNPPNFPFELWQNGKKSKLLH